jgi:phosphatidylglycerophosphate synthase
MIHRILAFIVSTAMGVLDTVVERIPGFIRPNHLTHARWVLTLPAAVFANLDHPWLAVATLVLSSICDILDGHLARRRGITTEDGAQLDAFADKFFVLVTIWAACRHQIGLPVAITVTSLEAILSLIRALKDRYKITGKSRAWGKAKTWAQSFGLAFALSRHPLFLPLVFWTFLFAIGCAIRSIVDHVQDIRHGKPSA